MGPPSFSIVLETENLANIPVEALSRCLEAITQQGLSPQQANEVLLIETGDVPAEQLERLRMAYPWLLIHRAGPEERYYEAKMEGFRHTTGQVVVFCDSDCRYGADWLRSIVEPFVADADMHVVAGETAVAVTGPYSLAMALIWSFAPFSRRTAPYRSSHYAANNVAFRRDVLLRCPIPCRLPMYRGNGAIHERMLRRMGYQIWKQPAAREIHPLPTNGPSQFFWRWLLYGHDQLVSEQFSGDGTAGRARIACWGRGVVALLKILSLGSWKPLRRLRAALGEDPRRVIFLPVAACMILATTLIALAGFVVACIRPGRVVLLGVERLRDGNVQAPGQENAGV
jgi:glycosyltransferase involved in cell wall biosynthesis